MLPVSFTLIDYGADKMPERMHPEDAGMDIYAPCDICVEHGNIAHVKLGFGMTMPAGYMAMVIERSSYGKKGLQVSISPIDSNYRGEVHAVLRNFSFMPIIIEKGTRFCQLVVMPCICSDPTATHNVQPNWCVIKPKDAPPSDRGAGCYGSTDIPKKPEPSDPLDRAGEAITLRVIGKPVPLSYPNLRKEGTSDISCVFDPVQHTVTIKNHADIVTLGIAVEILQQQYYTALKELSVDMQEQVYKVIKEVCINGQN